MAQEDVAPEGDLEVVEMDAPVDTAQALTSGIVITTTVVLLLALVVMEKALGSWFHVGLLK